MSVSIIGTYPTGYAPGPQCMALSGFDGGIGIDLPTDCLPPLFDRATDAYYSPGTACPNGYTAQPECTRSSGSQTTITCCPKRSYTDLTLSCVEDPKTLGDPVSDMLCTWSITGDWDDSTFLVYTTTNVDGYTVMPRITMSPGDSGINAYGIKMIYEESDLGTAPTTRGTPSSSTSEPSSTSSSSSEAVADSEMVASSDSIPSSTRNAPSASVTSSTAITSSPGPLTTDEDAVETDSPEPANDSLSTGTKAAIGAVVPLVSLATLLGVFFWYRRRKQRGSLFNAYDGRSKDLLPELYGSQPPPAGLAPPTGVIELAGDEKWTKEEGLSSPTSDYTSTIPEHSPTLGGVAAVSEGNNGSSLTANYGGVVSTFSPGFRFSRSKSRS